MPKRLTIEYVKEFVRDKTNGECEVLSSDYVNIETPLLIKCKCGNIFERPFHKLRDREIMCIECSRNSVSKNYRANINDVIAKINATGCEYLSGEYINNQSVLTIKCRCGNVFKKSYAKFSTGQDRCPECGKEALRQSKIKYSIDDVKRELAKKGYEIVDESEYIDCTSDIKCRCENGHVFTLKFYVYIAGHAGCKQCANNNLKSSKHWNYQGGETEVIDGIRKRLNSWKQDVKAVYGNRCAVTGAESKRLVVHHLISFDDIVKEVCNELGIELKEKIKDYDDYATYDLLKEKVAEKHNIKMGLPISQSVHLKFHRKYTKHNNTPEQFDEFLKDNYNTCLSDIQRKVNEKQ